MEIGMGFMPSKVLLAAVELRLFRPARLCYAAVQPPSIERIAPVIEAAPSLQR